MNVALQVICADTEERAKFVASSRNISRINSLKGIREPMISPEEASSIKLNYLEEEHLENINKHSIMGTPETVKSKIIEAMKTYETTDISIVTNCHYFEDRVKSFELIAEAFELKTKFSSSSLEV